MRVLVLDRGPKFPLPPEQFGPMLDAFAEWRERHRSKMESFEWFINAGGFGVVEVADERELQTIMLEFPFAFTDDIEVHPIIDGDTALAATREAWAAKMAGAPSG
jgi:hypothetical protein